MKIRRATQAELADVARLCWDYRAFLATRVDHVPDILEKYYAEDSYAALLADLPRIHARPKGDILVVDLNGQIAGCAMYYEHSPKTCEIKRIFLDETARGTGAAVALIKDAMKRAAQDGHTRMVLDTIHTLHEAIGLYERLGFTPCAPFYDPDPAYIHTLRFMDYALNRVGS